MFWKAIYCLLRAVFPALKLLRYCDSNIPAIDKIYFLVKRADEALQQSRILLDDQDLFGSMRGSSMQECIKEYDEVFGETNTKRNDKKLRYDFFISVNFLFFNKSNKICNISAMMTITMNSRLGMLFYLHGTNERIC